MRGVVERQNESLRHEADDEKSTFVGQQTLFFLCFLQWLKR